MVSFAADSATTADASAAVTTTVEGSSLKLDSIPIVDIKLLSQSELYSLSLCCSSSFDPHRCDDVVIPKIDRSVFNESAGSRKQTYSRLRLAPPSSSPIPIRRRTPHLRTTAPNVVNINDNTDPENAENSHIITLLKELFYSDVNPDGLVPVKIDYSHSFDQLVPVKIDYSHSPLPAKLPSLPSSYASAVGNTSLKRKRGRPRKKELFENGLELPPVEVIGIKHNVEGFRVENETHVRENLDDRDREFVNVDGVAVDFVDLGRVEHPFWEEIMRRTQGLKSEEEFLGFLGGLDGQWGSRRKKRRIVDARQFGSPLPIGWKLLLSVKKRNGRAWLYCRRPSGQQFVSCKDVSSYLLALHGAQIANSAQETGIVPDADKLNSVAIADHPVQDDQRKENIVCFTSPPAFTLVSGSQEMQISIDPGNLPDDKVREILHCSKCNMPFTGKDELLQHQASLHRKNRNKIGMRITDGVIIKEGKYECQFCHKTFSERHRYNGHVGTHVRNQPKVAGESETHPEGEFLDPIVPVQDNFTDGSLESQRNNVAKNGYEVTNDGPSVCSPGNKDIVRVGDSEKVKRNMIGADEPSDIVVTTNPCSGTTVFGTHNESYSFCGASDHACFTGGVSEMIDGSSLQRSGRCSPLQFHDETRGVMNSVITNFASAENLKLDMASEISLFNSNNNAKSCDIDLRNVDACRTRNEHELSEHGSALNELVFDSFRSHGVQDKDIAVNEKQLSHFEKLTCENANISHMASTSASMVSKPIEDSTITMLAPYDGKACAEAHVPCSTGRSTVDETFCFGSSDKGSSVADDDVLNRHKQMQYGISSVIPYNSEVSNHEPSNPGVQNTSKSVLFALSGHENNCNAQNNYEISGRKNNVLDNDQNFGIGELSDPFRSTDTALNSKSVTGIEQCRNLEDCFGFSSATDTQLFLEDNIMRGFSGALEEHKQEQFEGILHGPSSVSEDFDNTYRGGSIYTAPPSRSKFSDVENIGKHELSLSFGNLETKQLADSYKGKSFGIESSVEETYGLQTPHITSQNSITSSAQKQGKSFGMDFLGSSFNTKKQGHDNFNMCHLGRDWNGPAGTSGQNIVVDFGNDCTQTPDSVKTGSPWRTGSSNVLQGGFGTASNLQDPSSKCFRNFDLTSDKGEEGSFGVNDSFDILDDATRPGKTVPVEYSFMDELSSDSVPGESKIFPYVDVGQGLDPSFWLGNENLMTNTDGGHLVTSICVWCRNVFYHEPSQTRMQQTGAIGSMCPSCSNRIPGQFNVL
ncbi:uncharacterized protein [Henckelia pumila]|uniref:uncharacterized protein isoform X2 n=1 Tax=Henckelia pumila TaxID=405737 RepID=UPI003C6E04F4